MRQIVLDTETTGLSTKEGHRVIEIGCVEMIDRRLTRNNFHHYINPEREIDAGALSVHGISADFLKSKPVFKEIVDEFIQYIDGAELIIHNARFDVGFLNYEFGLASSSYKKINDYCEVIDTLAIARRMHPGQKNSLDALCKRYSVDNSHRDLHGALLDSEILADVYLLMTGGQVSMFANSSSENTMVQQVDGFQKVERLKAIPVIRANEAELAAHEAFLEMMSG